MPSILCSRLIFFHQKETSSPLPPRISLLVDFFRGVFLFSSDRPSQTLRPRPFFHPTVSYHITYHHTPCLPAPPTVKSHTLNVSRSKSEYFERKMCVLVFFTSSLSLFLSLATLFSDSFFIPSTSSAITAPWELLFYYIFSPVLFYLPLLFRDPTSFPHVLPDSMPKHCTTPQWQLHFFSILYIFRCYHFLNDLFHFFYLFFCMILLLCKSL